MVNFNDQAPVDMKLTTDLKDHSPIELTWAKDHGQFQWTKLSVDMKLTMDLKDHSPIELTWARIMVNFNGPSTS
jgi:carbonic anhydrase